jgi:hypothetical protein
MSSGRIPSIEGGIQPTIFDAKADILTATAADTPARLAVGTNGQVLAANSSTATGLEWQTISSGGGYTLLATIDASGASGVSFTSISGSYKHLLITWTDVFFNDITTTNHMYARLNNSSSAVYSWRGFIISGTTASRTYAALGSSFGNDNDNSPIGPSPSSSDVGYNNAGRFWIYDYTNASKSKLVEWTNQGRDNDGNPVCVIATGLFGSNSAVTQFDFIRNSTQTVTGQFKLWGVA